MDAEKVDKVKGYFTNLHTSFEPNGKRSDTRTHG